MNEHHAWLSTHLWNLLLPVVALLAVAVLVLWRWCHGSGEASQLKSDEQVILFPTAAHLRADGVGIIAGWVMALLGLRYWTSWIESLLQARAGR